MRNTRGLELHGWFQKPNQEASRYDQQCLEPWASGHPLLSLQGELSGVRRGRMHHSTGSTWRQSVQPMVGAQEALGTTGHCCSPSGACGIIHGALEFFFFNHTVLGEVYFDVRNCRRSHTALPTFSFFTGSWVLRFEQALPPVHVLGLSESYGDEIWVMKLGWDEGETPQPAHVVSPADAVCHDVRQHLGHAQGSANL